MSEWLTSFSYMSLKHIIDKVFTEDNTLKYGGLLI